jgi:hypothetical protein
VTGVNNGLTASVPVNVVNPAAPTGVAITGQGFMSDTGTLQLRAEFLGDSVVTQAVTWSVVSGSDLVTVNANGLVTGIRTLMAGDQTAETVVIRAASTEFPGVFVDRTITVNASLRAYYKLDGDLTDSSAYQHPDGRIIDNSPEQGGIHYRPFSGGQQGLRFVHGGRNIGTGTYIALPDDLYRVAAADSNSYTLSIWLRLEGRTQHCGAFWVAREKGGAGSANRTFPTIQPGGTTTGNATRAGFQMCVDDSGGHRAINATAATGNAPLNQWVHMVGVYTRTSPGATTGNTARADFYFNGVHQASATNWQNENAFGTDNPLDHLLTWIGMNVWDPGTNGTQAEVRLYDTALNATQVRALFDEFGGGLIHAASAEPLFEEIIFAEALAVEEIVFFDEEIELWSPEAIVPDEEEYVLLPEEEEEQEEEE